MAEVHDELDRTALPETPLDTGSQALSEALRSSFAVVKLVMIVLVFVFLGSGIFTVGPQERAIVLRMGKPIGEGPQALLGPGLHWSLPYPIDDHVKVSITGIQRATSRVGWYATTPALEAAGTEPMPGGTLNPAVDGYVISADENIVHSRATLTYIIRDPVRFVFNFVNASNAVQNALDNALVYAASHYKVDDILTRDIIGFNEAVRKRAIELLELQNLGVVVEQCTVQSIPPRQGQVKDAFANVLRAEVTRSTTLTKAHSDENQILSKASADAQSRINLAESERVRLVNEITARADQFRELLPKYQANPELFVQQRWTETLGRAITNVQDKIFIAQGAVGKPREVRLNFNRLPPKPKTENAPQQPPPQ
jgi:membrane protease subunit HflK